MRAASGRFASSSAPSTTSVSWGVSSARHCGRRLVGHRLSSDAARPTCRFPFRSRREIALTMLGGSAALWLLNHSELARGRWGGDFVYFKTPQGRWVAAAEDEQGRFFMIDEKFKIGEIAGIKLDRDVNVVAFQDGTAAPLPPGSAYVDPYTGEVKGPDELVLIPSRPVRQPVWRRAAGGRLVAADQRYEVDLSDPRDYEEQMEEQQFLADPDDPTAPILPPDFDIDALARQVEAEARAKGIKGR
eukprot:XP_001698618.1 predicted protein [Chlamydomonas reinhardtii]